MRTTTSTFKLFYAIAAFIALSATSCTKPDDQIDDSQKDNAGIKEIVKEYSIEVSDDYLYFFDIKLTSTVDGKEDFSETLSKNTFERTTTYKASEGTLPKDFSFSIIATPKDPVPEIDEEKVYSFEKAYDMTIRQTLNNGNTQILHNKSIPLKDKKSIIGSKMLDYLNTCNKTILDSHFTREE